MKYYKAMQSFYTAGKHNPAVALMLMQDAVIKESRAVLKQNFSLDAKYDKFVKEIDNVPSPGSFLSTVFQDNMKNETKFNCAITLGKIKLFNLAKVTNMAAGGIFKNIQDAIPAKQEFDAVYKQMYPRTGHIRKNLIMYRIRMDRVTPKTDSADRRFILEPEAGWLATYNRTGYVRKQLKKDDIPVKDMNFFQKLKYAKIFKYFGNKKNAEDYALYSMDKIAASIKP